MARPQKQGIDYFSLDVRFDSSLEIILSEHGEKGLGIAVRIWQQIYKTYGYYLPYNEDELYMIKRNCNDTSKKEIEVLIKAMVDKNLFNKEMFKQGILTSKRLQLNYKAATRKRVSGGSNPPYWVIDGGSNPSESTQKKLKETKVNKSITNSVEEKVKSKIPFREIIDYLNLKISGSYKHTSKKTRGYITTRWNEGFKLDDFYKVIDNTYAYRMVNDDGDLTYVRPSTIFNGAFEDRLTGTAFNFKKEEVKKKKSFEEL